MRDGLIDDRHGRLLALLLALTTLAGVVDAVSIARLNHVFVAAQTGNFVLIGLGIAGIRGFSVAASAISLATVSSPARSRGPGSAGARESPRAGAAEYHRVQGRPGLLAMLIALLTACDFDSGVRTVITVLLAASMGGQLALSATSRFLT